MIVAGLKPKYIPLVQKPFCCNVTCLAMILYRRGYGLFDQEKMAEFFKVKIRKSAQKYFTVKLGVYSRVNFNEGIKTVESAALVNKFFRTHNIPLTAKSIYASEINNLKEFITTHLKQNNDLWVEYKSHQIHKEKTIHDNVVESLVTKGKEASAVLVDPAGGHKSRIEVPLEKIKTAISDRFSRETGFIVISK